jgi:putative mRNA 3-end processing factor
MAGDGTLYRGEEILSLGNGIEVEVGAHRLTLDPRKADELSFVSHAHSDHLPRGGGGRAFATPATRELARQRGCEVLEGRPYGGAIPVGNLTVRFLPSGHILGSAQVSIEDGCRIVYTGDLRLEGGETTAGAATPRCDVLILEATFGRPEYRFPDRKEIFREMRDWIDSCHSRGITPVLLAYPLGKAQELTRAFSSEFPVRVHPSIVSFHHQYERLGVPLGKYAPYDGKAREDLLLLLPPKGRNSQIPSGIGRCARAFVSGWGLYGPSRRCRADVAFPWSDHSDFEGLVEYVEAAEPQVVYTVHGFARELSRELRERGFYSEPLLTRRQRSLGEFR